MKQRNSLYQQRLKPCLWLVLYLFCLSGCATSDAPQEHFTDYQKRLARILGINQESIFISSTVTPQTLGVMLPRKRERMLPRPDNNMNFFDFLRLDNCDVKHLVAKRNNQLGKHMQAANGITYEIAIRHALASCIPLESNLKLQAKLKHSLREKQQSLGLDLWHYSFGADWYGAYANVSTEPLNWHDETTLLANIQAWQALNNMLLPAFESSSSLTSGLKKTSLNEAIKTFESSQGLGKLQVSLVMVINELEKTNQLIAKTRSQQLCTRRADGSMVTSKQMDYFNRVVTTFFAKKIQKYLARLNRQGEALVDEQQKLLDALSRHIDLEYKSKDSKVISQRIQKLQQHQSHLDDVMALFKQKVRQHVSHVQRVQTICHH